MSNVVTRKPASMLHTGGPKAGVVALLCVLYLLNLSGGWIEIPDCLPIVGNLDEVAATVALMRCLERLGGQGAARIGRQAGDMCNGHLPATDTAGPVPFS